MRAIHICFAPPEQRIRVGERVFVFEFHDYLGPTVLGKNGDPLKNQPGKRSTFWPALEAWLAGGRRVDENGVCVWEPVPAEPPPQVGVDGIVHIGGRLPRRRR